MTRPILIPGASDADVARWLTETLGARLLAHGPVSAETARLAITVPGGSTPFPIFAELAKGPLAFDRLAVWPGDDRMVPEDHPASNTGRLRAALSSTAAEIVGLTSDSRPPRFALSWLGMGTDGHVASLFPNTDPRADDPLLVRCLTPDPLPPEAPFDRISLTIPALARCDAMIFVCRGDEKRAIFEAAARGDNDLPVARLLAATTAPVTCFC